MKKTKSVRELQGELLSLLEKKYCYTDKEIAECMNALIRKYNELDLINERRKNSLLNLAKEKQMTAKFSFSTIKFCDKLIVKEKVNNELMDVQTSKIHSLAFDEMKRALRRCETLEK